MGHELTKKMCSDHPMRLEILINRVSKKKLGWKINPSFLGLFVLVFSWNRASPQDFFDQWEAAARQKPSAIDMICRSHRCFQSGFWPTKYENRFYGEKIRYTPLSEIQSLRSQPFLDKTPKMYILKWPQCQCAQTWTYRLRNFASGGKNNRTKPKI